MWEDYYKKLMLKVVEEDGVNQNLLDYVDFHSYTFMTSYQNRSKWDYVVSSIHAVSLYYDIITSGKKIKSHITETNVDLPTTYKNVWIHWIQRSIENAKQIMSLSFNSDKLEQRHLFDLGASTDTIFPSYNFYKSIDYYMHDIIKPILDKNIIDFSYKYIVDGYPRYDNGNGIMSQIVYNSYNKQITALLINYSGSWQKVLLTDSDKKITWNDNGRAATYNGVNNAFSVTVSGYTSTVILPPHSVASIVGTSYSNPSKYLYEIEYIPINADLLMLNTTNTYSHYFGINIKVKDPPSSIATSSVLKFGFEDGAFTDYKWTITVKVGSTTYFTKTDFIPKLKYNEIPIESDSFLYQLKSGYTVTVIFSAKRFAYKYSYGRLVFASIMARYVGTSSSAFTENDDNDVNNDNKTESSMQIYLIISISLSIMFLIGISAYFIMFKCNKNNKKQEKKIKDEVDLVDEETKEYDMSPITPITPNDDEAVIEVESGTITSTQT